MEKLPKQFAVSDIQEPIIDQFDPAINLSRFASCNGRLVISKEKVYFLPAFEAGMMDAIGVAFFEGSSFALSEIESYRKTGLAGYRIVLKDGTKFDFSNVFGKMRKGIEAALAEALR